MVNLIKPGGESMGLKEYLLWENCPSVACCGKFHVEYSLPPNTLSAPLNSFFALCKIADIRNEGKERMDLCF